MIRYSFSKVMAMLEEDKHLAFTRQGEDNHRHLTMDSDGLYLSDDRGGRIEFKIDNRMLKSNWYAADKGSAMSFLDVMTIINNGDAEPKPTVRVDISINGKSAVIESNLNNILYNLYDKYTYEEIAAIMLSEKWYLVNKLFKRRIGGNHNG